MFYRARNKLLAMITQSTMRQQIGHGLSLSSNRRQFWPRVKLVARGIRFVKELVVKPEKTYLPDRCFMLDENRDAFLVLELKR